MDRKLLPAPKKPIGLLTGRTLYQILDELHLPIEFPKVPAPRYGRSPFEEVMKEIRWYNLMYAYRRMFYKIDPV